jgi:hypothetical protein
MARRSQNQGTLPPPSGGRMESVPSLIGPLFGANDTLWSVVREIAAENERRRRWPDDEIAWTLDQWERFMTAIEQTRGMALDGDGDLRGLGPVLFRTWQRVRGYLEADLNADEIHRALRSDAEVADRKQQRMNQRMLPLRVQRVAQA